jgi:hypothetical protein
VGDDDFGRDNDLTNSRVSSDSGSSDVNEDDEDVEKLKRLRDEIADLIRVQESLIREVVLRGRCVDDCIDMWSVHVFITLFCSELVMAEAQIVDVMKELDGHKEECYGHMKVIQELKLSKMQVRRYKYVGKHVKLNVHNLLNNFS